MKLTKKFEFKKYFLRKNEIKKYDIENLCIQTVYNLGLIENILYSYKNIFSYEENISYNELPLIIYEKENKTQLLKSSSVIVHNENDKYSNFMARGSIFPYTKRHSDIYSMRF